MNQGMYKFFMITLFLSFRGEKFAWKMSPWMGNANGKQGQREQMEQDALRSEL